ncbi:L-amino acid oxidase [Metarhizium rileyi]|uniref:L-amino acid oxidase n=1 Tax=Metarhizium rileyi (strain RCEF 4871) TaxID=1649241 RepID=A0A162JQC1_METRR|nr:L-amino acid oxidase [Metarhizium rileyi RCEF 4871]
MHTKTLPIDEYVESCAVANGLHMGNKSEDESIGHATPIPACLRKPVSFPQTHPDPRLKSEAQGNSVTKDLHQFVKQKLPKTATPSSVSNELDSHKVCIIGAGVAGLYIAMILDDLAIPNLTYQIVEASPRIGGRIYTHHFSNDKHDYYDVGAARFPYTQPMARVFDLFKRTGVPLKPYCVNGGEACPRYFNGRLFDRDEADPHHVSKSHGGSVPDVVVAQCHDLLEQEYAPYRQKLSEDFRRGFQQLLRADDFSIRDHLHRGGPDGTRPRFDFPSIQWMESQISNTGFFDRAFSRGVLKSHFGTGISWWCVDGGSALLTDAMQKMTKRKVETKKRVTCVAIDQRDTKPNNMSVHIQGENEPRTGISTVFNTATLPSMALMDLSSLNLHPSQREAISSIHYRDSAKVAIKFNYPWWYVHCGITGGTATTDLPLRVCVYPEHSAVDKSDKPSVLLASYTQGQDASRISTLINASGTDGGPLIDIMLRDLAKLHAKHMTYEMIRDAYSGEYHAYSWALDPYAFGGSFAPKATDGNTLSQFLPDRASWSRKVLELAGGFGFLDETRKEAIERAIAPMVAEVSKYAEMPKDSSLKESIPSKIVGQEQPN